MGTPVRPLVFGIFGCGSWSKGSKLQKREITTFAQIRTPFLPAGLAAILEVMLLRTLAPRRFFCRRCTPAALRPSLGRLVGSSWLRARPHRRLVLLTAMHMPLLLPGWLRRTQRLLRQPR